MRKAVIYVLEVIIPAIQILPLAIYVRNLIYSIKWYLKYGHSSHYCDMTPIYVIFVGVLVGVACVVALLMALIGKVISDKLEPEKKRNRHIKYFKWMMYSPLVSIGIYLICSALEIWL